MTTTLVTLTGDVTDAIGTDFDPRRTKAYVRHNTPKIVTDSGPIHLGGGTVNVGSDGTFSLPNVIASTSLVENLQATVYVDYADPTTRQRVTATFGPYDLSAETGTVDIRTLETVQALDPSYASRFMAQAQELLDAQIDLSGIDDTDSAVAGLISNGSLGPLTRAALNALYTGAGVGAASFGVVGDFDGSTGTNNSTALAAAIASGARKVVLPAGRILLNSDLVLDRTIELVPIGDGGDNNSGRHTQLVFASGKGIKVMETTHGRPDVRIGRIDVLSRTVGALSGNYGLHITDGQRGHYELMVEGFGDHGIYVDSTDTASLCNLNTFNRAAAIGCQGDGFRVEDNDSNVTRLIRVDAIGNEGFQINLEGVGKCVVENPHVDATGTSASHAVRDNGSANKWDTVYEEAGAFGMLLDTDSQWATIIGSGGFGDPPITDSSTAHTALILDPRKPVAGDTLLRNIVGSLVNSWTADGLLIRRVGNVVECQIQKLVDGGGSDVFLNVPAGFRPTGLNPTVMPIHDGSIPTWRNVVVTPTTLACDSTSAFNYARLTWVTSDAWPTTLPGVAYP